MSFLVPWLAPPFWGAPCRAGSRRPPAGPCARRYWTGRPPDRRPLRSRAIYLALREGSPAVGQVRIPVGTGGGVS